MLCPIELPGRQCDYIIEKTALQEKERDLSVMSLSKENTQFELEILDFAYGGNAFSRLPDGRPVFVPFTMPGERVRVRVTTAFKDYCTAQLEEVLKPAPGRVAPRCQHFTVCGGCHYQHLLYQQQLEVKQRIVADQLRRIGKITAPAVNQIIPSADEWQYRSTMQFHISKNGRPGFRAGDGKTVIEVNECYLPIKGIDKLWPRLDIDAQSGIRRVMLRAGSDSELLAALEGESNLPPEFNLDFPLSVHYLSSDRDYLLAGDAHNLMTVNGVNFMVSPRSFFQVNLGQACKMVNYVLANVDLNSAVSALDLYSGVGLFSAFLAPRVKELIAVESSASACDDFAANLDFYDNVSLYVGGAEQVLPGLRIAPDLVIVDPPRAGLMFKVVDYLVNSPVTQLVYVSCDPATLARDCWRLTQGGFTIRSIQPFDFFPQTYHVECVVFLDKKRG